MTQAIRGVVRGIGDLGEVGGGAKQAQRTTADIIQRPDGTQVMTHALRGVGGGIGDLGEVGGGAK